MRRAHLPGGESTTMAIVAARLGLLEPLRQFVKSELTSKGSRQANQLILGLPGLIGSPYGARVPGW